MGKEFFNLFCVCFALFFVFSIGSFAKNQNAGPLCTYQDLERGNIVKFRCDRFQSKGDKDSITPQVKILEPFDGQVIDFESDLEDLNEDGIKELPIKIVVNPEFIVDFDAASNAATQYAVLPQIDGLGHLHAYISPEIEIEYDENTGELSGVNFIQFSNRADFVGGFCVFRNANPELSTDDYQVLTVNCPLQASMLPLDEGFYKVVVDFTENSHGPRIKNHPRDNPPEDIVRINLVNVGELE